MGPAAILLLLVGVAMGGARASVRHLVAVASFHSINISWEDDPAHAYSVKSV
jgi:hypothetical protein